MEDLKLAIRCIRRRPGYAVLVSGMLALAIAGNTAIFSLVHSMLLAPLPFPEPERLVYLDETAPEWNLELVSIAYTDFHTWRQENRSFESMALHSSAAYNLVRGDTVERIEAARVTHDLSRVLGIAPALGRGFTPEEDRPGAARVAILGQGLWRRLFQGDPAALGQTLRLDGEPYQIVGVLPPRLRFPRDAELWVPVAGDPERDFGSYRYTGVGRLRAGVRLARAKADLDRTLKPLIEQYPFKRAVSSVIEPLQEHLVADSRQTALALLAAVALVLLVACTNVAALMLAAGVGRQRDIGVRLALGARRWTLVRQALVESLVLATVGGAVGLLAGGWALGALGAPLAEQLPFWVDLSPSPAALVVCFGAGLATTLLFGIWPAVVTSSVRVAGALHAGSDRSGGTSTRRRALAGLVVGEMAHAQALLVGAGLVALSRHRLLDVDPGFRPEQVLRFRVSLPEGRYGDVPSRVAFFRELRRRLGALPGVVSSAAISNPPLDGHEGNFFVSEGQQEEGPQRPVTLTRQATEGYLETMGIPQRQGRDLAPDDDPAEPLTEVVVNESFAKLYWPDRDPIGRRIRTGGGPWLTVVGVAGDVQHYGLGEEMRPGVYLPLTVSAPASMAFVLRTAVEPLSTVVAVRDVVGELDPELPLHRVTTMEAELGRSLSVRRATAALFSVFAAVALVLAAGGAFGVVSHSVAGRRREIGVRMALGARRGQILGLVLAQGCAAAAIGAGLGLAASVGLGHGIQALLYDVDARDPRVLVSVSAVLLGTALLANLLPAWRASRLQPMRALRDE